MQSKHEGELNHIRNKKKGGAKKNKEKTNALVSKLADLKKIKERADELQITMDYLEPGKIKTLKEATKQFLKSEDEAPRNNVLAEIESLIEMSETNRQRALANAPGSRSTFDSSRVDEKTNQLLDQFDFTDMQDIVRETISIE